MKTKDFYYDSDNGENLVYAKYWIPEIPPIGVIQFIHGMTEHTGRYEEAADYFTQNGFVCVMNDHLGHGRTASKTKGFFGYKNGIRHLFNDVNTLKQKAQEEFGDIPYFFLGVSMGSYIERLLIAENEITKNLSGAIIAATSISGPNDKENLRIINDLINDDGPKKVSNAFNGTLFGNINESFKNEEDPLSWVTNNIGKREQYRNDKQSNFAFTNAGYRDLFNLILKCNEPNIIEATDSRLPLLFISGKDDPIGNFGNSIRKLASEYLKAGTDDLTVMLFPKVRHDVLYDFPATQNRALPFIRNWILARLGNSKLTTNRFHYGL